MPDERGPADAGTGGVQAPRRRPALPPDVVASLHAAFQQEVRRRVPRLRRLRRDVPGHEVLAQAQRDAHTLASSAVVVGEAEAARCARALEGALGQCLLQPLAPPPPEVLAEAERLASLLDVWLQR